MLFQRIFIIHQGGEDISACYRIVQGAVMVFQFDLQLGTYFIERMA